VPTKSAVLADRAVGGWISCVRTTTPLQLSRGVPSTGELAILERRYTLYPDGALTTMTWPIIGFIA